MEERSRIRFNPATKEIEIEGSEEFVRTYFGKVQKLLLDPVGSNEGKLAIPRTRPLGKLKKAEEKTGPKSAPKKTLMDTVVGLVGGSKEGITTTALKVKTGLAERQIWSIIYRAEKRGIIKKTKRGIYVAA
jgi:hypothetical protein